MHLGDATKPCLTRRVSQDSCRTHRTAAHQAAKSCTPSLRRGVVQRASQLALPTPQRSLGRDAGALGGGAL